MPFVGPIISLSSCKESGNASTTVLATTTDIMDSFGGISGVNTSMAPLSRLQEKKELQQLNNRFSAYVARVRHLALQARNVDASAFLQSTKVLEEEITKLKDIYENELDNLRKEIEESAYERTSLHIHCNKQQKYIEELQDRLSVETDKNSRLLDEINILQRRISNLQAEVNDAHIAAQRPQDELDQLERSVENLTREVDHWKHRYEKEQVTSQQNEERLQQIMKKAEFSDQVQSQQTKDYKNRLDTATSTILSLEARLRELSTSDVSVSEMLKQVQDTAEADLRKYQMESEEQYIRNLSALKIQMDCNADTIQRLSQEKNELVENIGELQAKIRNLEGQVQNLQHQKKSLEDAVAVERNQGANSIRQLEKKLREMQDLLVTKMTEVTSAHESNIPLKAEIEALKALLEDEERRLRVPLGIVPISAVQTSMPQLTTTLSETLKTNSLSAPQAATSSYLQPNVVSSSVQKLSDSKKLSALGMTSPLYQYDPYPNFSTSYIPEALHSGEENTLAYDIDYDPGLTDHHLYGEEVSLPGTGARYLYEASPSLSRLHVNPSPPLISKPLGPVQARAKSAPIKPDRGTADTNRMRETKAKEKKWNYIPAHFGCGRDYFEEMFHGLQKNSLFSKPRPKSSPLERQMPSSFHDYTVSTSNAIGDLKILEVNEDGKYVRLVNDGPRELEIGGYMIRQNVDGHPVAVFKFPPNVKIPPSSIITVWSAMNDPDLHNPPTDFFWKEVQRWETGPECSTILCRTNGQAEAWITAAHRYSKDVLEEATTAKPDLDEVGNQNFGGDIRDDESLSEQNMDSGAGPRSEPVNLKREKQQPPLLASSKQPHGGSSTVFVNSHAKKERPPQFRNMSSTFNNQSKTKNQPDQNHSTAVTQNTGNMLLKTVGNSQQPRPPTIRGNGTLANKQSGSIHVASQSFMSSLQEQLINETRGRADFLVPLTS